MRSFDVLIIGSGHAGAQAAISLRLNGYAGSIGMIGREGVAPYERPPLSKEYLAGDKPFERMLIRPEAFWDSKAIALELDAEVTAVDPDAHTVAVAGGDLIGYGVLVWAAGGDARRLSCPGSELAGIHAVRHRADADRLRDELAGGARRAVVIGGGYIGLEAAAVLRKRGCQVVLIEAEDRVLNRVAGTELSRFYEEEHRRHGVDVRLNASVVEIEGAGGHLNAVRLGSGEVIACDVLIVGIGIIPAVGPLQAAGAAGTNGVLVDEFCRTGLPDIYAIGDCASHANVYAQGAVVRLESVQNANDMAITAAKAICGYPQPYRAVPWFWSNQYDLRLQTVGLSLGHDEAIVRGAPETRSFSVVYLRRGRVVALDCVNATKDYVQGRRLVEAGAQIPATVLRDPARSFKELAI